MIRKGVYQLADYFATAGGYSRKLPLTRFDHQHLIVMLADAIVSFLPPSFLPLHTSTVMVSLYTLTLSFPPTLSNVVSHRNTRLAL